jgi:hypothetical protein
MPHLLVFVNGLPSNKKKPNGRKVFLSPRAKKKLHLCGIWHRDKSMKGLSFLKIVQCDNNYPFVKRYPIGPWAVK